VNSIRVLSSEHDEDLRECLIEMVREAVGERVSVETVMPATIHENDLLKTAAEQQWDLAMLILNNILYSSNDRSAPAMIRDAGNLIRKMKQLFGKPIVCFFGWPDDPEMIKVATEAGAEGCFRLACSADDVLPTLRRCLDKVPHGPTSRL
jgi:hypothetical protein